MRSRLTVLENLLVPKRCLKSAIRRLPTLGEKVRRRHRRPGRTRWRPL